MIIGSRNRVSRSLPCFAAVTVIYNQTIDTRYVGGICRKYFDIRFRKIPCDLLKFNQKIFFSFFEILTKLNIIASAIWTQTWSVSPAVARVSTTVVRSALHLSELLLVNITMMKINSLSEKTVAKTWIQVNYYYFEKWDIFTLLIRPFLVTRYHPVTGVKSKEARYLKLGTNFNVDRRLNNFVRTTVRLKPNTGEGSIIKVNGWS